MNFDVEIEAAQEKISWLEHAHEKTHSEATFIALGEWRKWLKELVKLKEEAHANPNPAADVKAHADLR